MEASASPPANLPETRDAEDSGAPEGVKHRWGPRPERSAEEMKAFWKLKKQEKKQRAKAARAERKQNAQASWQALSPEEQARIKEESAQKYEKKRALEEEIHAQCSARLADTAAPRLIFDLQFEHVMNPRGVKSTVSQVKISYASLRRAGFPLVPVLHAPTLEGPQSTMINALKDFDGFRKYPPVVAVGAVPDVHTNVVYLTADTDTVLWTIEPNTAYVVGAFVDHNIHKGLTSKRAQELGLRTARLPLQESVEITRLCRVLTINHVVDCLISFMACHDWKRAFIESLPTRRQDLRASGAQDDDDDEEVEEGESGADGEDDGA